MANSINGAFIGTTSIWDPTEIYSVDVNSQEFKDLLVRMYQNLNKMSMLLNMKTTGTYDTQEFVTGNTFFHNPSLTSASSTRPVHRPEYRITINFGALPSSATTKSVAHGLVFNSNTVFTGVYAAASDTTSSAYIPIPYSTSTDIDVVELDVDGTNVNITTGKDMSAFDTTIVVLSYLKS